MSVCGVTAGGGWHCAGTGCLAGGAVCMHDVAADPGVEAADRGFPWIGGVVGVSVSREALGLELSVSELLGRAYAAQRDAMARAEYVRLAGIYGDTWCSAIAYAHGFAWYPPLNPKPADDTDVAGSG